MKDQRVGYHEEDACRDGCVGNVEGRPVKPPDVEIEKIHDEAE